MFLLMQSKTGNKEDARHVEQPKHYLRSHRPIRISLRKSLPERRLVRGPDSANNTGPRRLFDLRDAPINVMWNIDTPIICALNGAAAGYGMDISLLCDIRIAAESSKMAA